MTPALFVGHGNPMNALQDNAYSRGWRALGSSLSRPRAILAISAHWYVPGSRVTAVTAPRTIHDFGGFPLALFAVQYPAPGDPALAARVRDLLAPIPVALDHDWGLDHGTWSVLCHVFPDADVPVVQLSIDETQPPEFHYAAGKRLARLREEGVLVFGSGNVVHNLHAYAWGRHPVEPFEWALRFEEQVRRHLVARDHAPLVSYPMLGADARLAVPTPEHYLPLLYVIALARDDDVISFPVDGIDGGSVSMLAVRAG
jgi:4,5-DOPA dioxygenase extradiol